MGGVEAGRGRSCVSRGTTLVRESIDFFTASRLVYVIAAVRLSPHWEEGGTTGQVDISSRAGR